MSRHGKRYVAARDQVDREREHTPAEAIALIKSLPAPKFDETLEVHVRTGLNVRHADEQLRGARAFPGRCGLDHAHQDRLFGGHAVRESFRRKR